MIRKECLFVSESSGLLQNVLVLDKQENQVCSFKGGASSAHSLCFIGDNYIASADKNKPLIQVRSLNRQDEQTILRILRIVAPAPVLALAVNQSGTFCAGSCGEKILIWQLSTGHLVNTLTRHYQNVNVLKFTDCGGFLISGGAEGMVNVWTFADLVDQGVSNQVVEPRYSFSHHTVAVGDVWVGAGGARSRFASCSSDQTCILYELASGKTLLKIVFDVGLRALASDLVDSALFIGAVDGRIFQVSLHTPPRSVDHHLVSSSDEMKRMTFSGHTGAITCLSVTRDGTTLASGSADNSVILWDVASKNRIRTFLQKGAITNLCFRLMPRNVEAEILKQNRVVSAFKRQIEERPCDTAEVFVNLKPVEDAYSESDRQFAEVSSSVATLQKEIDELKSMNDALYRSSVKKIFNRCGVEVKRLHGGIQKKTKKKKKKYSAMKDVLSADE